MTSASKLFYNRRSRSGRASATETTATSAVYPWGTPGFDFLNHHDHHDHHVHILAVGTLTHTATISTDSIIPSGDRLKLASCMNSLAVLPPREHVSLRIDAGAIQAGPSSSVNVSTESNSRRSGHTSTDRLPGSVLLARERLLERLRGVSVSGSRRNTAALPSNNYEEHTVDDRWRLADVSDWGVDTLMHSPDISAYNTDVALQSDRSDKKPPGLTQDMINRLDLETYCNFVSADGLNQDCSICLESFLPGDKLLHLPCEHRFHYACLDPWVRTCGDCPYCRKAARHNSETGKEKAYY